MTAASTPAALTSDGASDGGDTGDDAVRGGADVFLGPVVPLLAMADTHQQQVISRNTGAVRGCRHGPAINATAGEDARVRPEFLNTFGSLTISRWFPCYWRSARASYLSPEANICRLKMSLY